MVEPYFFGFSDKRNESERQFFISGFKGVSHGRIAITPQCWFAPNRSKPICFCRDGTGTKSDIFYCPDSSFLAVFTLENGTHTYRSRCPTLYLSLIERIEIHNPVRIDGHKRVQVNIYFTGVGRFKVPNEAELISLFNETQSA